MIALTKTLDPADLDDPAMRDQLVIVDRYFDLDHVQRRWEYALALVALQTWAEWFNPVHPMRIADVGGAGSPFHRMTGYETKILDPKTSVAVEDAVLMPPFDAVISISTFEHTTTPLAFLDACHRILKPGGLLFLTFDYTSEQPAERQPEDRYHFRWMRERIMNFHRLYTVRQVLKTFHGYIGLGAEDLADHGSHVYDYTFASLCLRKPV